MRQRFRKNRRHGAVLPLVVVCMAALMGMLALSIDVGVIAVARSQAQNAADAAAMAAARTINGITTPTGAQTSVQNISQAPVNGVACAMKNYILGTAINNGNSAGLTAVNSYTWNQGDVTIAIGSYAYVYDDTNPSAEKFQVYIPIPTGSTEPYGAAQAWISSTRNFYFAQLLGMTTFNTTATAVAAHRPRDVVVIMDMSGSMRFESLPGTYLSGGVATPNIYAGPRTTSMNPDPNYPKFGPYSSANVTLYGNTQYNASNGLQVNPCNLSYASNSGPPICAAFTTNAGSSGLSGPFTSAFTSAPASQATTPGGDNYLKMNMNTGASWAVTPADVFNTSGTNNTSANSLAFCQKGYTACTGVSKFNGYTQGPSYWGTTFFMWPPDPRGTTLDPTNSTNYANNGASDWRQRFFFKYNTSTNTLGWLDQNPVLFNIAPTGNGTPATAANPTPNAIMNAPGPGSTATVTELSTTNVTTTTSNTYYYMINYQAILTWLQAQNIFPSSLQTGRVQYYTALPSATDNTLNNRWWTNQTLSNNNEMFWRTYIDFVLGLQVTGTSGGYVTYSVTNVDPSGNYLSSVPLSGQIGCGDFFQYGTPQITAKPVVTATQSTQPTINGAVTAGTTTIALSGSGFATAPAVGSYVVFASHFPPYQITAATRTSITLNTGVLINLPAGDIVTNFATQPQYMNYLDNPYRPQHQFWFGPMTMVDFLGNYNTDRFWWPGNVPEAQAWACKAGIQTAIGDMQNNHPNDFVGLTYFSTPMASSSDTTGLWNNAVVPLGQNYSNLQNALWFPITTVTGTDTYVTPYSGNNFMQVPRAQGGTAPQMSLMIAYNMLSSSTANLRFYASPDTTYRGSAGGLGRKGAWRIVIFETDGFPTTTATANIVSAGSDSYYPIRIQNPANFNSANNVEWPSVSTPGTWGSSNDAQVFAVVQQITAQTTASPPGYSTTSKPAQVYPIGYGSLFDPSTPGPGATTAETFLTTMASYGNTSSTPVAYVYGTPANRVSQMQAAFTTIMQSGIQVSLLQ
jgi:Flp pilus assembly protein TadG